MTKYEFTEEERNILESMNIPFVIYQYLNKRVVTLLVTNGMCKILGMPREKVIKLFDRDMYKDTHPDDKARVADAALKFAQGGDKFDCVYRSMSHILNDYAIVHSHGEHFFGRNGTMLLCTMYMVEGFNSDIENKLSERVASNFKEIMSRESLIRDNFYDTLTGLPNMSYFLTLSEAGKNAMLENGETPCIVYLDLTGMKYFNEKYGLREGDNLIVSFAQILKKYFANENCGRMGQDHFAVFTKLDGVEEILKQIFEDTKYANEGRSLPVHVGIYSFDFENVTASSACDRAKIASDKEKGAYVSKYTFYDKNTHTAATHYEYVINNFEMAMEKGWIRPYYQQIIRVVNGLVSDEEALARWEDPVRGLIPPNYFIYVLEDAKLIHKLDLYILECVIRDLEDVFDKSGQVVPVSINLSKYDFQLCDMVAEIDKRIKASKLTPDLITIELTESVSSLDSDFIALQIKRFHEAGYEVWMDDFGSGFSSLNVLQQFDFDLIKFDMRFMRDFDNSSKSRLILQQLVQMATKLNIDTVVEGVETMEQVKFLREIGASKVQGFYFAKPIPLEEWYSIYNGNRGNLIEDMRQADYYALMGKVNVIEPNVNTNYNWQANEFFGQMPTGVLEFRDNNIYVMRDNNNFSKFLIRTGYIDEKDLGHEMIFQKKSPAKAFVDLIYASENKDEWILSENLHEGNMVLDVFIKYLATNPVTNYISFEVVIVNIATV